MFERSCLIKENSFTKCVKLKVTNQNIGFKIISEFLLERIIQKNSSLISNKKTFFTYSIAGF
jgi:hypothetical protein